MPHDVCLCSDRIVKMNLCVFPFAIYDYSLLAHMLGIVFVIKMFYKCEIRHFALDDGGRID